MNNTNNKTHVKYEPLNFWHCKSPIPAYIAPSYYRHMTNEDISKLNLSHNIDYTNSIPSIAIEWQNIQIDIVFDTCAEKKLIMDAPKENTNNKIISQFIEQHLLFLIPDDFELNIII